MKPSLERELYVISTSHLDTVWSWELEQDIREYLPQTFTENFDLMRDFPNYKFNFEGAYRYQLLKEYYPERFEELKRYMANGQWNVAGSALENGDVNVPSPEALFRNILYGNNYFDAQFGQRSRDIYLPDCFGFGYALPSVIAHAHLQGFATQKLHWGAALKNDKLPYDLGVWKGPDGAAVIGDININDYTETFETGFANDERLVKRVKHSPVGKTSVLYGSAGDRGGAVPKCSVEQLDRDLAQNDQSAVKVRAARVDDLIRTLYADPTGLSTYDGELLMHTHGTGSYTSQAVGKRWNRMAEQMAYAAEQLHAAAWYLGADPDYPTAEFETAWTRVIAHQFHDDITGTSNASTYLRSRNDYMLSVKQFAAAYESGAAAIIRHLDTRTDAGAPVVVCNPLAFARTAPVQGSVTLDAPADGVRVLDDAGRPVPAQILSVQGNRAEILFSAELPPLGLRVYRVLSGADNAPSALTVTENRLENERFVVQIDQNGDLSGIYDKTLCRELLRAPIRLALFEESRYHWAAWEIQMADYNKAPSAYVDGKPELRIVERGPVRVAVEITRRHGKSTFVQTVSLSRGGDAVTVDNRIDWQETATLLKCVFPLTASNNTATYDLGLGAIARGNNRPWKAEVPMQKWADLTDRKGGYGVSVLNDCKYGIDKPKNDTLRLTCIHTPRNNFYHSGSYGPSGQDQQDLGEHRFSFALYSHAGDWCDAQTQQRAEAFNQPLTLFETEPHAGALGTRYSFGRLNNDRVLVRAVKKAEKTDEIILRVNEGSGRAQTGVIFSLGNGIRAAREMYASEEEIAPARVENGKLCFDIGGYAVKTFALTLNPPERPTSPVGQLPLSLPYNADAYSFNHDRTDGSINGLMETYPAELVPNVVRFAGISYPMGDKTDGAQNAVRCAGQTIPLPAGYRTLYLLTASTDGDRPATFLLDGKPVTRCIADYSERVAAGDSAALEELGYVKPQTPAFVATHRHTLGEDNFAKTTYLFRETLDLDGARELTLPDDRHILLFSAVLADARPAICTTALVDARPRTADTPALLDARFVKTDDLRDGEDCHNVLRPTIRFVAPHTLRVSGEAASETPASLCFHLLSKPIPVHADTTLRYRFLAENEGGRRLAVDLSFSNGKTLRTEASPAQGKVGEWVEIIKPLGEIACGYRVTELCAVYANESGDFAAQIADLEITEPTDDFDDLLRRAAEVRLEDYGTASAAAFARVFACARRLQDSPDATARERAYLRTALSDAMHKLTRPKDGHSPLCACDFDAQTGLVERQTKGDVPVLGGVHLASSVTYQAVDFGDSPVDTVTFTYAGGNNGKSPQITLFDGGNAGDVLCLVSVPGTGDWETYQTITCTLRRPLTGQHDLTLNFKGKGFPLVQLRTIAFR